MQEERFPCDVLSMYGQLPQRVTRGACVYAPPQLCVSGETRSFGLITRHIRAYRQDARAHPVLPDEQRSK